jgi:RNA polymerase sigma factor (sigma-70 family)
LKFSGLPAAQEAVMTKMITAQEEPLVAAAMRGCSAAFGELCQPFAKRLVPTIQRITRNREDAEDALQDSFLRAFVHIKDFDGRSKFSTWLTRIAINSALMIIRRRRNFPELSISDDTSQEILKISDYLPNPEASCAQRERESIFLSAIEGLRPSLRRVLQLRDLQERSTAETAQIVDISIGATKGRLFHARAALRKSAVLRAISQARTEPAA